MIQRAPIPISKTQRKKQVAALQELGAELVALSDEQLAAIDLPESLRDAVLEARRTGSFEGRRRQLQYVGKLMRTVEAAPIRAALDTLQEGSRRQTALHKRAVSWRERLLAEPGALTEFLREYPRADAPQLAALVRGAQHERETGQPPRHFRALYQLIRALLEGRDA